MPQVLRVMDKCTVMPIQDRPDTEIGPGEGRGKGGTLKGGRARRGPLNPPSSSLALLGPVAAVPLVAVWNVDLSCKLTQKRTK